MTESGKVATNSDGQLRFVYSASPGLGCTQFLVVSLILAPNGLFQYPHVVQRQRPPLRSALFCLFDAGSHYITRMSL